MNTDYKEIAIYAVLALIIVLVVFYVLSRNVLVSQSFSVSVSLAQVGNNYTYPYQTSHYLINITNTGHNQITDMLVGFYINGQQQSTNTISLPAGESITFLRNYTYPSPGSYTLEAVADPGHILDIANRNTTQSAVVTDISLPEIPNVYTSIPNTNISSTQSFKLTGLGALDTAALDQNYNISIISQLFGPAAAISPRIFENAYAYTANVYGASATYSNNAVAYVAWMQGTVNPHVINYIVNSFGIPIRTLSNGTESIGYARISNTTSLCTYYSYGWTKMISYYNSSLPGNCAAIAATTYNATESNVLIDQLSLNSTRKMLHFQSGLFYVNSTITGSSLQYSNDSLSATNIFEDTYGLFIATVRKLASPRSANAFKTNSICYGLIYNNGTSSICSYILPTKTGNFSLPYGLINSTYLTTNYSINMYSLVNNTELVAAQNNAGMLLSKLNVSEPSIQWESEFHNSCAFENTSIGCTFKNLTHPNNTAFINITNHLPHPLRIDKLNCEIAPGFANVTINETVAPNASIAIAQHCNIIAAPFAAAQDSYTLILTYTYTNTTSVTEGFLNVTSTS